MTIEIKNRTIPEGKVVLKFESTIFENKNIVMQEKEKNNAILFEATITLDDLKEILNKINNVVLLSCIKNTDNMNSYDVKIHFTQFTQILISHIN